MWKKKFQSLNVVNKNTNIYQPDLAMLKSL